MQKRDDRFCSEIARETMFVMSKREITLLAKLTVCFAKGGTGAAGFNLDRPGWKDHCSVQVSHLTINMRT